MKVIFLDFDGVLNSTDWMQKRPSDWEGLFALDPYALIRLERLLNVTGAVVVLTSTKRLQTPLVAFHRKFLVKGLDVRLIPRLIGSTISLGEHRCRGREIDIWLKTTSVVSKFVILDDDDDMEPHMDRLVKIDGRVGLQDSDVDRAISLLID